MGYDLEVRHDEEYQEELRGYAADAGETPEDAEEVIGGIIKMTGAPETYRYSVWGMSTVRRFMKEIGVPDFVREQFETTNGNEVEAVHCGLLSVAFKALADEPQAVLQILGKGDLPTEWELKAREEILTIPVPEGGSAAIGNDACPQIPGTPQEDNPELYERQVQATAYWMKELDDFAKFLAYAATQGGVEVK